VNSKYSEKFIIRAKWKLGEILVKRGGHHIDEGQDLLNQATKYIKQNLGVQITFDTPGAQDIVDSLVFYWNR